MTTGEHEVYPQLVFCFVLSFRRILVFLGLLYLVECCSTSPHQVTQWLLNVGLGASKQVWSHGLQWRDRGQVRPLGGAGSAGSRGWAAGGLMWVP